MTHDSARVDTAKIPVRIESVVSPPSLNTDLPLLPIQIESNAITSLPAEKNQQKFDWDRESTLAAQSSSAQAARAWNYRDLSSLTPEQLDWVKKNHVEPMPGFQWDRNSRGEMLRHGIVKLNHEFVLIVFIPFCGFGGKIQYNGDLSKKLRDSNIPDQ